MIKVHPKQAPGSNSQKIAFPTPTNKKRRAKKEESNPAGELQVPRGRTIKDLKSLEMACASPSMISANSCSFLSRQRIHLSKRPRWTKIFSANASSSSSSEEDCNAEECAPEKEVGKVSMEWLAGEKTKVAGTFPPKKRGWTGYVDKDTAGQTNIYSVEPAVYVAESSISSGSAGSSSEGAENTAAITAGLALISIAAASSILLQVDRKAPQIDRVEYSGPPLSYYINKFKPATIAEAVTEVIEPQSSPTAAAEASVPPVTQISSEDNAEVVAPAVQDELKEVEAESPAVSNGS